MSNIKSEPKIGIVTVLYNSESVVEDFFATLNTQLYKNFVLYVIDNKSQDNALRLSKELANNVFFETKFTECDENYGVAKGNNIGIKKALGDSCDMILLSNNDVKLNPTTIFELLRGKQRYNASLAVPKIYTLNKNQIWYVGGKFRYISATNPHFGQGSIDIGQYNIARKTQYAPTCFMLIDKDVFERIGFMDELYFVYYDDSDFIYRANKNGETLFYIPSSTLVHKESVSTGGNKSDFFIYYFNRNMVYFTLKNLPTLQKIVVLNFYIVHLLLRKSCVLMFYQWRLALKAHLDGVKLYLSTNRS
jgi:GT2 family glycosyltransferase